MVAEAPPPLINTRRFGLAVADDGRAAAAIGAMPGVLEAVTSGEGRRMTVTYDLRRVGGEDIERRLDEVGARPAPGPLETLRRRFARFTEANLLDQSRLEHHCCSQPPDGR